MRKKLSKEDKEYRKRLRDNKNLAKKALKDSFKIKPSPGLKFLYKVPVGQLVESSSCKAILLESTDTSCIVYVTSCEKSKEDSYYLGRHRWAPQTEVKVLG
tara:strand:+ start:290 stop:592 length:303 start_codon:yes stop_codon:yes gene_type:complete